MSNTNITLPATKLYSIEFGGFHFQIKQLPKEKNISLRIYWIKQKLHQYIIDKGHITDKDINDVILLSQKK